MQAPMYDIVQPHTGWIWACHEWLRGIQGMQASICISPDRGSQPSEGSRCHAHDSSIQTWRQHWRDTEAH